MKFESIVKICLGFIVFMALGASTWARPSRGGDDVGNGGGLAEKNLIWAYQNLEALAAPCLLLQDCRLSSTEKMILKQIVDSMPEQRKFTEQLIFMSEQKNPGTFILDGAVKVAKTGNTIGDPIFINTDLLYARNKYGVFEAVSIPMSLAILLHELGHHVSKASHDALDLMGVKVSMFLQNRTQSTPTLPWTQAVSATIIQPPATNSFPLILLNVGEESFDLSIQFRDRLNCPVINVPVPAPLVPVPDFQLGRREARGAVLHNIHWERAPQEGYEGKYTILGNLSQMCPQSEGLFVSENSFRARIKFEVEIQGGKPVLKKDSARVVQSYEPWYKKFSFRF